MATVEIYMKTSCSYCVRALQLLKSKQVEPRQYVIDAGGPLRQEMVERSGGRTTVPQIFVDGRHVGGCDDLMRLERLGELDSVLAG